MRIRSDKIFTGVINALLRHMPTLPLMHLLKSLMLEMNYTIPTKTLELSDHLVQTSLTFFFVFQVFNKTRPGSPVDNRPSNASFTTLSTTIKT